ncbi:two-component regulator propeller domain-containing protein [Nibrella saemangeumensis]|uniref:Two-component regulator propeller domain-containing protein n=1 Tax=Nibrella saemangeumensis TaxID=1084526 RepID=A0ABP8N9B1_9BACT
MNRLVCLSLLCLSGLVPLQAQYRVRHYTIRDGLAQGGAYYMLKDSRRYLWFLSEDGLTRFDGTRFVNYFSSKTDPASGPTGDTGSGLVEAANGDLWFGTEQCLNHYHRPTNRFTTVFARDAQGKSIPAQTHVFATDSTRIWYINQAEGLLSLDWKTGERKRHSAALRHNSDFGNDYIRHHPQAPEIWMLMPDKGVLAFNYQTRKTRYFFSSRPDNQAGDILTFSALYPERDGTVWLAGKAALVALDPATGQFQTYNMPSTLGSGGISGMDSDSRGTLWLGTKGDGIYQFSKTERRWAGIIRHDPYDVNSLATNTVSELLIDPEGVVWVNADPMGVDQLTPDFYGVRQYQVNPFRPPSLSTNTVWKLVEDRQGQIWIGTYMGGIDVLNPDTERVRHYDKTGKPGSLPGRVIFALYADRRGRIWIGADDSFCYFNASADSFVPIQWIKTNFTQNGLRVVAVWEEADGRLLLATRSGMYRYNPATNRITLLAEPEVAFSRTLHYDSTTRYLFAGRRLRDLICYRMEGDSLCVQYTALPTLGVQDITPDKDPTRLWVATTNGLYLLRAADGKILRSWNEKDGLPHRVVYSALPDRLGRRWLSTNRGIAVLDPQTGQISQVQSIEPAEFNNSAYLLTSSGEMYFGSTSGLYRFDPLRQRFQQQAVTVNLTRLLINDRPIDLDSSLAEIHRIVLQPDQRTLTLQFGAIDYFSGGQNRYRYRLKGYDQNWVESGLANTARYANLPPGDYTFEVLAADAEGRWMNQPRRLAVVVKPAIWQTDWFKAVSLLLLGGIIYAGFRRYLRRRLRQQRREFRLQATTQQAERERIARDLHDHIGPDLVALKLQLEAIREDKADLSLRQMLNQTIAQANRIVTDLRQVSHALMPVNLQQQGLIDTLEDFIRQVTAGPNSPEINFTHELAASLPETIQQSLLQIAKELIHNALKHAQPTVIDVELYQENGRVLLAVSDNGQGYNPELVMQQARGIGFRNIQAVVKQLKGQLEIVAKPTGGMRHLVEVSAYKE